MKRLFSKKDLVKLFIPLVIELLLNLMVGMIDSVMVASVGESAMSGVSLVDTVMQLLIFVFSAFGTGGAVVCGQYLGAKEKENACRTTSQLLWFSWIVSMIVTGIMYMIRGLILNHLFGSITVQVSYNANRYFLIVLLSIPAISIFESGAAIFRTMGNSRITMYLSFLMNLVNVTGNAIFIYGCGLGSAGAAIATVAARYVAAVLILVLLLNEKLDLHLQKTLRYRPDGALIRKILYIGVPNGVENGLFQLGKVVLVSLVSGFGTSAIAANSICHTMTSIQVIPGVAMQTVATTVIARCVGAEDEQQTRYYNRLLIGVTYAVMAVFCLILWFGLAVILPWYHVIEETALLTRQMLMFHTFGAILVWPVAFVLPASMRAAGDVKFAMVMSIISMWVFRILSAYLLANHFGMGAPGVWAAMPVDWAFRAIVFGERWLSGKWKGKSVVKK